MRFPLVAVLLATAWVGCVDPDTDPRTRRPRVEIVLPVSNVIGNSMDVDVQVNGCTVSTAALMNGDRVLRTFAYTSSPTRVTLVTSDIPFAQTGVAAELLLTAAVTCDDGREGLSAVAGAVFLPVAESFSRANDAMVVPSYFYAEGTGAQATFVGCEALPNGDRHLVRRDRNGTGLATIDRIDVMCDDTATFTDAAGGIRWMLVPGVGALAFDTSLHVTSVARSPWSTAEEHVPGATIVINPADANAIIWWPPENDVQDPGRNTVYRIRPNCLPTSCPASFGALEGAPIVWGYKPGGPDGGSTNNEPFLLLGDPLVTPSNLVVLPGVFVDVGAGRVHHQVRFQNYNTAAELEDLKVELTGATITYGTGSRGRLLQMTLSPVSTVVYLPWATQRDPETLEPVKTEVRAYSATTSGSALWRSPTFDGMIAQATPFAGGSRLAAVGDGQVWFLHAGDGTLLNPGTPANARNGYKIYYLEPGAGQELYIMTGPATTQLALPREVIGFTSPDQPEVLRYTAGTGNLMARVDNGGQLWLRVNSKLHRTLSLAQYLDLKGD